MTPPEGGQFEIQGGQLNPHFRSGGSIIEPPLLVSGGSTLTPHVCFEGSQGSEPFPDSLRSPAFLRGPGCLCLQVMEETGWFKIFFCSRFALAFELICLVARGEKGAPRTQRNGHCAG